VAEAVKGWIEGVGAKTAFIERASPRESGYVESSNGKPRDELLDVGLLNTLGEAQVLIGRWRRHCNEERPHSSLGCRPPAPETLRAGYIPRSSGPGPTGPTQLGAPAVH
jgi:putative transposase